jgi:DNA-binding beta-propeller fold protein YncE
VALVTADLEAHLVAVETATGRIVKRVATAPGPRSIESNAFGQALVAHTTHGRVSVIDAATLSVRGEIDGFGEPRYAAMHPTDQVAYVSDSKRREVVVVDLARRKIVARIGVPGAARHLSLNSEGTRLWTALGTKARTVVVIDVVDSTRPRLMRTILPPFLAHDVVFAPDGRAWVTSGTQGSIAVYGFGATNPDLILPAATPPQHIAFSGSRAYVASGEDGTVRVHRLDGSVIRAASRVPLGSYNIVYGGLESPIGPVAATPSLDLGTISLLSSRGSVRTVEKVARSAHDACIVEAG